MLHRFFRRPDCLVLVAAIMTAALIYQIDWKSASIEPGPESSDVGETVILRSEVKRELAQEVADGRRSLFEAAAIFDALDKLSPPHVSASQVETSQEAACRQVINWVDAVMVNKPTPASTIERLQLELRQALNQPGGIQLPELTSSDSIDRFLAEARRRLPTIKHGLPPKKAS